MLLKDSCFHIWNEIGATSVAEVMRSKQNTRQSPNRSRNGFQSIQLLLIVKTC